MKESYFDGGILD